MSGYRYSNLTSALRDRTSPLRRLLDETFPHTRPVLAEYRSADPPLLVPGGRANPATLGAAFDFALRFRLDPAYDAELSRIGFSRDPRALAQVDDLISTVQRAAADADWSAVDRGSWALALLTDVYRVGLRLDSAIGRLALSGALTASALLALAPADAVRQLAALGEVAAGRLLPYLHPPYVLGPTFDGSRWVAADADLIADGLLLEVKTRLGVQSQRPGGRADRLQTMDLYQLVAYVLLDHSDAYRITRIGVYSARYGRLATWELPGLLDALAGSQVSVRDVRDAAWRALGAG